jgi:hypothetical protein
MRPEYAKPLAIAAGRADGITRGAVVAMRVPEVTDLREGGLDAGVAQRSQVLAGRAAGGDRGEALLDIAVVLGDVDRGQRLDRRSLGRIEVTERDEVIGDRSRLVAGPRVEADEQRRLVDQAGLQGEQSEQQVSLGVCSGHGRWLLADRWSPTTLQAGYAA